ncbi:long-chain-fatty-acid--CoA ligase [Solimonas sp. K1W22B-7]|uniref:long-chain-fatty-acid--CoA ligase n=1 Tax=Solimonas sp. K1W22B-7 TaxID=2303331 RepID=UPI000E332D37|nr:long-chain-fatty-acid--CoA ligase [Solimonas sp. K1W22B-7]AXQ28574.1 long-chain-fatty-acid--CoA ligase [Solimonas sp. K1W22B-7]
MATTYLTQGLHRARSLYPGRLATVFGDRRRSYGELVERVARLAGGLQQLGVRPGDRVGVLAMNSDRYLELYYAIWWAGGVINPLNIRWSPREIAYSLDDCQTQVVVVDETFAPMADALAERSQALRTVIYAGDGEPRGGMFSHEQLIAENAPAADAMRSNEDLAGIFYTGGTTGFPKGVMLSHANLWACASTATETIAPPGSVALHAAPMFHLADGMFLLAATLRGCTQVIVTGFEPVAVATAISREQVSVVLLVPTMIQMLVDHPQLDAQAMRSLRRIVYGASPINEALLERAMQRLPEVDFVQAYGLTEMSPLISILGPEQHNAAGLANGRLRSAGQPCACVEVRIAGADGCELPRGSVGEITARGPGVMQGYWGKPEQTAAALRNGWLHTGDGAYMDEDGFIFVVDRVKDMIVSGGENVYSAEVENAIAQHPAVAACAVIGVPDARWGESVHAVIVCRPERTAPTAEELRLHCRDLIAGYKCPRSLEVRDTLPLSGTGKVLKTVLREPYWKEQKRHVG